MKQKLFYELYVREKMYEYLMLQKHENLFKQVSSISF